MAEDKNTPNPENPNEFIDLKLDQIKDVAAGIPAVFESLKMVFKETNPLRSFKVLNVLNQQNGIDCPGCAWPDPDDDRSRLGEYCENGVKAIVEETTSRALTAEFFKQHSISDLANLNDYEIGKKGRIVVPLFKAKDANHYSEIPWEEAFSLIGNKLKALSTPNEAVFYTSGRTSNEAAYLYQLFARQYGTNNLPDCSNMCHESSGVALTESLGIGKGSVTLDDFYIADLIIILGQNPGTNHPRMLTALSKAKENGAMIISVNPLPETGLVAFNNPQTLKGALGIKSKLTDLFLQVKINGDLALILAIEKLLKAKNIANEGKIFDHNFINENTIGYEELMTHLDNFDLNDLVKQSGVSIEKIEAAAEIISKKNKIIACWAMGLTQHKNAVNTIKEVVNLLLLKGSIGKPGAGTCPVRGHSNVQGDRTMGIYEKPPKYLLENIEKTYGFVPPKEYGYDVVECINAMHEKKVKLFIAMGGNFLSATPDTLYTAAALSRCDLTVQISTKLNRSHLITGEEALILPALGRSDLDICNGEEMFVSCENSMGIVQMSKGNLKPLNPLIKSEVAIVCGIAQATFNNNYVDWNKLGNHNDNVREDIEKVIPGFSKYNERVRSKNGFALPNPSRVGTFKTETEKAHFNIGEIYEIKLEKDEYLMMTIRSHDQFNTTIYGLNDRYRGISNERRVIFMNDEDIKAANLASGDIVDIYNYDGGTTRVAHKFIVIPFSIPKTCVATYFPETNVLVPITSTADKSNTPTSKSVVVKIVKVK
jgi:molybdopterin-dependent oxidoreductase alpha subunit